MAFHARSIAGLLLTLACAAMGGQGVSAQAYPERPIRMVVPYPPGGQFDIHARLLGDKLKDILGQPIFIENRPGAATMIGAEAVARSPNDGYTLLFAGANMFAILPQIYARSPTRCRTFSRSRWSATCRWG
jgi:tripartite-type tricarboxylate transporter receptor subunit TctC